MLLKEKNVLVLYEFFYPGFKAGGPVQSLVNMIESLNDVFNFSVATTAFDLQTNIPYSSVKLNSWNSIKLGNSSKQIQAWYSPNKTVGFLELYRVVKASNCTTIFINGFYTRHFLFPLIYKWLFLLRNRRIIVSPRGMLQQGALQLKSKQKKLFLNFIKVTGLMKGIIYHATTKEEEYDIKKIFGENSKVFVAGNIPKMPLAEPQKSTKIENNLKLVYLSLITEKKNLLLVLNALKKSSHNIELDIYGPVKDNNYWNECLAAIKSMPTCVKVLYKENVEPAKVQTTLRSYDALILLTKGENFGHALYESLSVGTPIITSYFTPWINLQNAKAGWNIDIDTEEKVNTLLNELVSYKNEDWQQYCNGAHLMAKEYYYSNNFMDDYTNLFKS